MITCYLDSQDYSALTDPRTLTNDRIECRNALISLAREGKVRFVFSAAAVCESVSISPEASRLAELRAELLSDLCGANALVSFDRVLFSEVMALRDRCDRLSNMLDQSGNWFPEISLGDTGKTPWQIMRNVLENDLEAKGVPRQQRRALARQLIKNDKPRGAFKKHVDSQDSKTLAKDILTRYPMKQEYAEMMSRYCLGRATESEFHEALLASLRDPRWMMKWFATNHALSNPVADIVRKPGRELGQQMRNLLDASLNWVSALRKVRPESDPSGRNGEVSRRWIEMEDSQLVSLVKGVASENNVILGPFTPDDVDMYCPGISATVRSLYSSIWDNVIGARKERPSDSQPVDALHAMYAPYVQVFRSDRFMAPHIQRQVNRHGTIIVPRLANLVELLKERVKKNTKLGDVILGF